MSCWSDKTGKKMNKQERLHAIFLSQKKHQELKMKIDYQIRMLAVQYKKLGFTNKQIADTFNKASLTTPTFNKPFSERAIQAITSGINSQQGKHNAWSIRKSHG